VTAKRLLTCAICLLAMPAPAASAAEQSFQATTCQPNQTVAALDQYCDFLPTSAGASTPMGPSQEQRRRLEHVLTPEEAEQLREAGVPGKVLLVMPTLSPVTPQQARAALRRRDELERKRLVPAKDGAKDRDIRKLAEGVASAAGDAVGGAFRWGLVLSSLGLAGISWLRFRSRLRI
jgi:hypothetical protein